MNDTKIALSAIKLAQFQECCLPEELTAIRNSLSAAGVESPAVGSRIDCPHKHRHTTSGSAHKALILIDPNSYPYAFLHCSDEECRSEIADTNALILEHFYGLRSDSHRPRKQAADSAPIPSLEEIVRLHPWTRDEIAADPLGKVTEEWKFHYILILLLFPRSDRLWTGTNECQTGSPDHASRFRPVSQWAERPRCDDTLICPNPFKVGLYSRKAANVSERRFFVVRSDTLPQDHLCSVFRWLEATGHTLRAVVETEGASLEAWFDYPPRRSPLLKMLTKENWEALQCDPRMAYPSTPCRLPGTMHNGSKQSLIYYKPNSNYDQ